MSFLRGATLTLGSAGQPFLPINIRGTSGRKVMVNGIIPTDGGDLPSDPEFNSVTITGPDTGSTKALNVVSGSVSAVNAYITDNISASKISVDNIANPEDSHVRCYSYEFRQEAEADGWNITQLRPSVPPTPLDDALIFSPAVSSAIIGVIPSDFNPNVSEFPNIILDPQTQALGGRIQCSGIVKCPKFAFGTEPNETQHWTVEEDPPGNPESDNLVFRAPGSTSVFKIKDNSDITVLQQNSTQLNLNTTVIINNASSLRFGSYDFKPIELKYTFTGATLDSNPSTLFNSATTDFIRTNDGATVKLNDLGEAVYILSIDAGSSSSPTTIGSSRFMCNFPYMVSANASGSFSFSGNFCINTTPPAGFIEPTIEGDGTGGPVGSTNYSFVFSSITSAETFNGIVKITRLSY
jgi:hypothetical protein